MRCEEYKAKFDSIFHVVGAETASIWKGEKWSDYIDALGYTTYIRGQRVDLKLAFIKEKIEASIYLGDRYIDHVHCFSKKISFSLKKSEAQIAQDLIKRLELGSVNEKVSKILEARKARALNKENEKYRLELFKKFLPLRESYCGKLACNLEKGCNVELDPSTNTLQIRADSELLIALCANINQLLKK